MSLLCRLGFHVWNYVGEVKQREPFGWSGWNHECLRCKRTAWFSHPRGDE